jgi:hypothetical protein
MTASLKTPAQTRRDPNARPGPAPDNGGRTGPPTRLGVILAFLSVGALPGVAASRRATAIRRAVTAGLPPGEVAASLGVPLSTVQDALAPR